MKSSIISLDHPVCKAELNPQMLSKLINFDEAVLLKFIRNLIFVELPSATQ